jgi:dihydrofolate synthase/folylpolyglutamate synthase
LNTPRTLDGWLELLEQRHPRAVDLGLERSAAVWRRMGSPRPAPSIFVVAGTNGKGSTVATICALLYALGLRQGSYTTPHLHRYNERVQLGGAPVDDGDLLAAFERVEAARDGISLTYFEFGTLAAFDLLARAGLDFAVMEIGLGGRLDAVNLLDADCAVITPIGLDHQEYLGPDRESIGREKAGVIRPGRAVVCGEDSPPDSVRKTAAALGAPLRRFGIEFTAKPRNGGVRFQSGDLLLDLPAPVLPGPHQVGNMATAVAAVLELLPAAADRPEAIADGLRAVRLPGRFERLSERPALWLDVGHNPLGAEAIAETLRGLLDRGEISRCRCVLAMLVDKDAPGVAAALRGVVQDWYCAGLPGGRGQTAAALAGRIAGALGDATLRQHEDVAGALAAALQDCGPDEGVLVFGSFLTAAAAAEYWRLHHS